MTTANLLNVSSVKGQQVDVSKKLQEEAREVTEIFASMMNQTFDVANQMADDTFSKVDISKADATQTIANSYERYSYKDNRIETTKESEVSAEEMDAAGKTMEQAQEGILGSLSEEYGVDEEALRNLLDEMGLSVLDLLEPQNLVNFIMTLTGIASGEELLLDESFHKVMEALETLSDDLMKELNVDMNGLRDIITQMKTMRLKNGDASFDQELEAQLENLNTQETTDVVEKTKDVVEKAADVVEKAAGVVEKTAEGVKVQVDETDETDETKTNHVEVEETVTGTKKDEDSSLFDNRNTGRDSLLNQDTGSNQVFVTGQPDSTIGQVSEMPQMQISSYFSVDTTQIMEQIAEQIRVIVTPDTTSMEMQLNPENLGKIYLDISSKEGVVNAQFIATNDVVKEALEAQIATLRENLTQAGVKVDTIEVTIASHEFEQNLEQNQKKQDEQIKEENAPKRRNLVMDSFDDLQGVMTEEESLAAQIMKDNGNSVDFTA